MPKTGLKHKIKIDKKVTKGTKMLSDNSFGIFFCFYTNKDSLVFFKPLNDYFLEEAFSHEKGILLNFERDLIEEDDIEYALDVMSLFNKQPQLVLKNKAQVAKVKSVVYLVVEEYNTTASYIMIKTLLKVLLLHLIRIGNDNFIEQDLKQKRVFDFLELMETYFLNETQASFYAKELGLSEKRLNQILNEKLNLTAKQIIQQRQITEAKRQLVKKEVTIKELAFELGFESLSSFSRFFKKHTGVSPSKFSE
ncbi:helix-turn-helix domain-containing protein [Cellulophaga omnivescoria]|uniref:helix-turn-helix domain-containing protein n=1 Tax=Cellulophaga omnivescoria TaxID=1888890 RepID=UPI000985E8F6|nr:helix-turn-helix domain-containing protein [Cellulophaga omnivescoria]